MFAPLAQIRPFFDHRRSDQRTQYTWIFDPCFTPNQKEKLIYYEIKEHVEFSTLVSYSFEVEYDSCLDVIMHALAFTAALHECWEFWIEDVLVSEEQIGRASCRERV